MLTEILKVLGYLWGAGLVVAGIWMLLIISSGRQQKKEAREEAEIKAKFDDLRRKADDKMFRNVEKVLRDFA